MNYGEGTSFARYRRSGVSKYNKNQLNPNHSYDFGYNDRYSVNSSRGHRNPSYSLEKQKQNNEERLGNHHKTQSHSNILDPSIVQNKKFYSHDQDYKSNTYDSNNEGNRPLSGNKDLPSRNFKHKNQPMDHNHEEPKQNVNNTVSYDEPHENILPDTLLPRRSESPKLSRGSARLREKQGERVQDSLEHHLYQNLSSSPYIKRKDIVAREDVERQSIEQDRYFSRLNHMNNKQLQIFEKYLLEQHIPAKDKEKHLEEIERK